MHTEGNYVAVLEIECSAQRTEANKAWREKSLWCAKRKWLPKKGEQRSRRHQAQSVLAVTQSHALTLRSTALFPGQAFHKCPWEPRFGPRQDREMLFLGQI